MLPVSLNCPILIVPSVFSSVYLGIRFALCKGKANRMYILSVVAGNLFDGIWSEVFFHQHA
jgi:ABC-type uncharacterized transport system involved in gliding motility auxiliary subunit